MSGDIPPITRNGVRLWQSLSGVGLAAALTAIGWNWSQLEKMNSEMAVLVERTLPVSDMRGIDATLSREIAEIRALQQVNMRRIDVLEDQVRNKNGRQ